MKPTFTRLHFLLILLQSLLFSFTLAAQQNGSFETWLSSGKQPPFDWKYPTGWTTNNATTEFTAAGVTRNNYNYSGEFAAQIKTLNIFGTLTRSQLALGTCQLDYPHYQVKANTGGEPLSMVPNEVTFYYQLTTGSPAEHALAEVLIKRGSGSSTPDTVYYASMVLPAVGIYTEMQMIIPDVGINMTTDSIVILFSSNDTNEVASNILYVDDVSIDFTNSIHPAPEPTSNVMLYPNPVHHGETLTIRQPDGDFSKMKIYDVNGRMIGCCLDELVGDGQVQIQTCQMQPGLYFLVAGHFCSKFVVTNLP